MGGEQHLLEAGDRALAAGDWDTAAEAYRAALEVGESGHALAGLGEVLRWLGENAAGVTHLERAYAVFRREHARPARRRPRSGCAAATGPTTATSSPPGDG